jgi:hypothetical protein
MEALIRDVVRRRVGHAALSSSHGAGGVVSAGFGLAGSSTGEMSVPDDYFASTAIAARA